MNKHSIIAIYTVLIHILIYINCTLQVIKNLVSDFPESASSTKLTMKVRDGCDVYCSLRVEFINYVHLYW